MISVKTRNQLVQDLINAIKSRDSTIETTYGPVKDLVIDPVSLVVRDLYTQLKNVYDIQFIKNANIMTREELDALGETFGIFRKGAIPATGSVFFLCSNKPVSNIFIPSGISVATSSNVGGTTFQTFIVTKSATFAAATADSFFNPESGYYEFEVPIRALTPGKKGNVAPGTIRTLQRQIPGISGVINKAATVGGRDIESNAEYARRIRLALLGSDRGTYAGLERFALNDARVLDAKTVMSGDPLMKRTEAVAGAVDVYILGEEPTIDQQVETFLGLDIFFQNEPVIFPNPVSQIVGSLFGVLTEGIHYFIEKDVTLEGSIKARNIIRWNRGAPSLPTPGELITIEYSYDKLILDLQNNFSKAENNVLADVLFRRSTQINITLDAQVKVFPDISISVIEENIRSAIKDFINTRGLGESIVPSDLDLVIRSVPGVDFVFLPFTVLDRDGGNESDIVVINKNEYAQISDSDIKLTLTA